MYNLRQQSQQKQLKQKGRAHKKQIKNLEMIIGGSISNLKEVKQTRESLFEGKESAFSELAIKDAKQELTNVKTNIEKISINLSEGINMIRERFEVKLEHSS